MILRTRRPTVLLRAGILAFALLSQVSCGLKLIQASNGLGATGGAGTPINGPSDPSKPTCEDLALNSIMITLPSMGLPPNLQVSINQGQVTYDACQTLNPGEKGFVGVSQISDTRIAVNVMLWPNTPIRNFYFGTTSSGVPVRTDFAMTIWKRDSCMGAPQRLFSLPAASIRWQKGTADDATCPVSADTYHGHLDIY